MGEGMVAEALGAEVTLLGSLEIGEREREWLRRGLYSGRGAETHLALQRWQ